MIQSFQFIVSYAKFEILLIISKPLVYDYFNKIKRYLNL